MILIGITSYLVSVVAIVTNHLFLIATPPYIPTVTCDTDISNFDTFEAQEADVTMIKGGDKFNGIDFPFVGFSYFRPRHDDIFMDEGTSFINTPSG